MEATVDLRRVAWHGRDGRDYKAVIRRRRWWRTETGGHDVISRSHDGVLVLKPIARSPRDFVVFASGKSNYLISKLLNQIFNATAYTFPSTSYFRLWTTTLTAASTGSSGTEAAYTSYAAVAETNNATNFSTSSSGSAITNNVAITWPANTGASETETFLAICDASTAGNILYWGSITSTAVGTGATPQINTSGLSVSES